MVTRSRELREVLDRLLACHPQSLEVLKDVAEVQGESSTFDRQTPERQARLAGDCDEPVATVILGAKKRTLQDP